MNILSWAIGILNFLILKKKIDIKIFNPYFGKKVGSYYYMAEKSKKKLYLKFTTVGL